MERCPECNKSFTPTSWTRDNHWRKFCPKCIVELLDKHVGRK